MIPPQRPLLPGATASCKSSFSAVKIIGSVGVPRAMMRPPRAITRADAFSPCPSLKRITAPGSMVSTCPSLTKTNPSIRMSLPFAQVTVPVPSPKSLKVGFSSSAKKSLFRHEGRSRRTKAARSSKVLQIFMSEPDFHVQINEGAGVEVGRPGDPVLVAQGNFEGFHG